MKEKKTPTRAKHHERSTVTKHSSSSSRLAFSKPANRTPATSKADILISIKPVFMDSIVARKKDHEFRSYLISSSVQRMWLYVSSPDQTLRYIAVISAGKTPGDIEDEDGMGNSDFNAGFKTASYAYEIKELYQLRDPLSLKYMQEKYRATFPQRFAYVTENMLRDIVVEDQIRLF